MKSLLTFTTPGHPCSYLPGQRCQLQYEVVGQMTPAEYLVRMKQGWRRFGFSLFTPACPECRACRSLRVDVARFRPDRSQRRVRKLNGGHVLLSVGPPAVSDDKLALYDRFHAHQTQAVGWPAKDPEEPADYVASFVEHPFPTQEWCYRLGGELVGVGYVDVLPGGLSAIYFFYDPALRDRSLGVWNVLSVIDAAAEAGLPYVYLGFYVEGCRSLEYKARYRPNEVLGTDGQWREFLP